MRPILITGPPGIGKSTLIQEVLSACEDRPATGILSDEVRVDGKRHGFTVRALDGTAGMLASPDLPGEPRFGTLMPDGRRRLGLSLWHLESVVIPEVERQLPAAQIAVIDEIGPMQAESVMFRRLVRELIAADVPLVASIGQQEHEWLTTLRNDRRFPLIELTHRNRGLLADLLSSYVTSDRLRRD
jgi:nucleoside-triphosphatase THEP1